MVEWAHAQVQMCHKLHCGHMNSSADTGEDFTGRPPMVLECCLLIKVSEPQGGRDVRMCGAGAGKEVGAAVSSYSLPPYLKALQGPFKSTSAIELMQIQVNSKGLPRPNPFGYQNPQILEGFRTPKPSKPNQSCALDRFRRPQNHNCVCSIQKQIMCARPHLHEALKMCVGVSVGSIFQ